MSKDKQINLPYQTLPEFSGVFKGKIASILYDRENVISCLCDGEIRVPLVKGAIYDKVILSIFKNDKLGKHNLSVGTIIGASLNLRFPRGAVLPGEFSELRWANYNDALLIGSAKYRDIAILGEERGLYYYSYKLKQKICARIDELFSYETASLLKAVIMGERSEMSKDLRLTYSKTGTAHLFAISGFHIGIISVLLFALLGFVRSKWLRFVMFSILILVYVFVTGLPPSAVRAGLLAILALFIYNMERGMSLLNLASFIILFLMFISPKMIHSVGFQMSSASIIGIALFFEPISKYLKEKTGAGDFLNKNVIVPMSLTFSASVVVSPIVSAYFGVFSMISPIANLVIIPLMSLALIFAIIALIFSYFFFSLGLIYAGSVDFLYAGINSLNEVLASFPFAYIEGEQSLFIAVLCSLLVLYLVFSSGMKQFLSRFVIMVVAVFAMWFVFFSEPTNKIYVYPREQFVLIYMRENSDRYAFVVDRKPNIFPRSDYAVEQFILKEYQKLDNDGKFYFGYNGNAGINLIDKLKKSIKLKYFLIDLEMQNTLQRILGSKVKIPQII